VIVVGIALGLVLQFVRAWTEPIVAPPGGNLGAPINTGPIEQLKQGALGINGLLKAYNGLQVPNGNVGIGTTNPKQALEVVGRIIFGPNPDTMPTFIIGTGSIGQIQGVLIDKNVPSTSPSCRQWFFRDDGIIFFWNGNNYVQR